MADLLLELYSEDIPARLQAQGATDLARLVTGGLVEAGVECGAARTFATPRRLALVVRDVPTHLPPRRDERKGPRVNAPDAAVEGFLRSVGLDSVRKLQTREDAKGAYYVAVSRSRRRAMPSLLKHLIPEVIRAFPWPKSMRWGEGTLRWVRPLRSIVCLFDGGIVSFEAGGLKSGRRTRGHPVLSPGVIGVRDAETYEAQLGEAHVCLDPEKRVARIRAGLEELAGQLGAEPVMDEALLREAAGQVEWPVMCAGGIDDEFMDLPDEFLTAVMRTHQQYFSFRTPGRNRFAFVADGVGGENVIAGNENVLRARLADMRFHWDRDRRTPLAEYRERLKGLGLHPALKGTVHDKTERMAQWARLLCAELRGCAPDAAEEISVQAAELSKADLVTGVVREFPGLQGIVGRHLADAQGLDRRIAAAIGEHYAPLGPSDKIPETFAGRIVSLADKLETLTSFFDAGEAPTGSGDPHGLRRAALGVIRIVLEGDISLDLHRVSQGGYTLENLPPRPIDDAVFDFFADRLKVHLRGQGMRHDVVAAVMGASGARREGRGVYDFVYARRCAVSLLAFLRTDDGANLLVGYKRAANIVRKEKGRGGFSGHWEVSAALLREPCERDLHASADEAGKEAEEAMKKQDFTAALAALAKLRAPIDAFFDSVTVNVEEQPLRLNRLALLSQIEATLCEVADFSRIEGGDQTRRR